MSENFSSQGNPGKAQPDMIRSGRRSQADSISLALRQLWSAAESEDTPDEFMQLLDQLDEQVRDRRKNAAKGSAV